MSRYHNQIQHQPIVQDYDIVFIRHAESHFNSGTFKYIEQKQLFDVTWYELLEKTQFNELVTYNPDYIDAHITQKGKKQCFTAKQQFNPSQIQLILVSPQQRTLQTCRQIFGPTHPKVIIHPLITQVFRYSCDVSHLMQSKIQQFSHYDFNQMKQWSNQWFIQVLSEEKQKICEKYFKENNLKEFKQKQLAVVEMLSQGVLQETAKELRDRVWKIKELVQKYKKLYNVKKIAVVSHHYTTQCLLTPGFNQDSTVKGIGNIQNGKPYFRKLQDIMKVK